MTIEAFASKGAKAAGDQVIRLRGTVTTFVGEDAFFLQDATAATLVYKVNAPSEVKLGDVVDVFGTPGIGGVTPHFIARGIRLFEHGPVPAPLVLDAGEAPWTGFDGMLVRFRGRVENADPITSRGQQVRLNAWSRAISLVAPIEGDPTDWPALGPADLAEVTGILSFQLEPGRTSPARRLILQRRGDLSLFNGPRGGSGISPFSGAA